MANNQNGEENNRLGYDAEEAGQLVITKAQLLTAEESTALQQEIDKIDALMKAAGIDENDPDLYTDDDPE